jgi:hypothetical protein
MTPKQFTAALETLGWSQRHLATLLACDTNLPTRWARGTADVPPSIGTWLADLARHHHRHPTPTDWRSR